MLELLARKRNEPLGSNRSTGKGAEFYLGARRDIYVCFLLLSHVLFLTDPDAGKDWGQEKGATEDEIVGRHHRLNGHEFEQTRWDSEGTEAWRAVVHGVVNIQTQLSYWTTITRLRQKKFFWQKSKLIQYKNSQQTKNRKELPQPDKWYLWISTGRKRRSKILYSQ